MIAALKTTPSTAAAGDEQRALSPLTLFFSGRPLTDQERAREVADEWHHVPTEIKAYLTEMLKTTDTEATADEYWYNLTMQEQLELSWRLAVPRRHQVGARVPGTTASSARACDEPVQARPRIIHGQG